MSLMSRLSIAFNQDVDLIVLNEVPVFLQFQVIKNGKKILERSVRQCRLFETRAALEYFDYLPTRKRLEASVVRHLEKPL